jgi:subtilisin family serine protease
VDALARLKAANADLERRDAALRDELAEARDRARVTPEGRTASESVEIAGERVSFSQFAQETIVRKTGRPVLAVIRHQARLSFEEADSRIWKERLERAGDGLAQAAAAIGRIEVEGHALAWLGTGWLVAPDIIVTNRHVAGAFGRRQGTDFVFRQGLSGAAMSASIDFLEEMERADSLSFTLSEILHIEEDDGPDVAFLRVRASGKTSLARPIALAASTPEPDEAVAVIGYPARDSRIPDVDLMERIYGNTYDKKRLAPGVIMRASRQHLQHDCTTLGGNSGSAVISLATGDAVGLHFAGTFLTANHAVPSTVVQERLEQVTRPGRARAVTPPTAIPDHDKTTPTPAPIPASTPRADARPRAQQIPWSADLLSQALNDLLARHDYRTADRLIAALEQHVASRSTAYPALYAHRDLAVLRKKRQFALMRRYAAAVTRSGTNDMRVQRQHGQALIELGEFDAARTVLQAVVARGKANRAEEFEALGLIGRSYKQQFVDDPGASGAEERLRHGVDAYRSVYDRDRSMVWHGVNLASCTMRAHAAGMAWAEKARATEIAEALLTQIDVLEREAVAQGAVLDVWHAATRVEALVNLGRMSEADASLDAYLAHPDLDAFEVSSTHRQFSQVLQLDAASTIMQRLSEAVERLRGGGALGEKPASSAGGANVSVLFRVSDPAWQPSNVPGLVVHSRTPSIISAEGSRDALRALLRDPRVMSIEESRPGGTAECTVSMPLVNVDVKSEYKGPSGAVYVEQGDMALVAVIDDGIDIHHEAFLGPDGSSRIVGIWHQTKAGTPPPGFTYGSYYDAAAISAAVAARQDLGIGRNEEGHGTHVASIAAGTKCGAFGGGVAPAASLLVVITDNTSSIGYSRPHADALTFIDAEATRLGLPVVVNVSQGMNSGAHDGKSPLEARFNAFCSAAPGRVVVKSAGNEGSQGGHAKFAVGQDSTRTLRWRRPQRALWPYEHLELWWRYGNELEFQLGSPSGDWSAPVTRERPTVSGVFQGAQRGGTRYRLELVRSHPDHGDSLLRVDIDGETSVESGVWELKVVGRAVKQEATIHAWIERGDPSPSQFETFQSPEVTLSIPGTAEYVIAVGAIRPARPFEVGEFSSSGPTRDNRQKPDVVAPGVNIAAANGGTANGVTSKDGTSMAAPHVAGAIALALSKGKKAGSIPTAMQVAVALRQNTLNYTSHWNPSEGYGVLDVRALLAAL